MTKPKTFEEAWAEKEAEGYLYGSDALEQVRFGWEIAHKFIDQRITEAQTRAILYGTYLGSLSEAIRLGDFFRINVCCTGIVSYLREERKDPHTKFYRAAFGKIACAFLYTPASSWTQHKVTLMEQAIIAAFKVTSAEGFLEVRNRLEGAGFELWPITNHVDE